MGDSHVIGLPDEAIAQNQSMVTLMMMEDCSCSEMLCCVNPLGVTGVTTTAYHRRLFDVAHRRGPRF